MDVKCIQRYLRRSGQSLNSKSVAQSLGHSSELTGDQLFVNADTRDYYKDRLERELTSLCVQSIVRILKSCIFPYDFSLLHHINN